MPLFLLAKYVPLPTRSAKAGKSQQKARKKGRQKRLAKASIKISSEKIGKGRHGLSRG
jgi:hypothetical protein